MDEIVLTVKTDRRSVDLPDEMKMQPSLEWALRRWLLSKAAAQTERCKTADDCARGGSGSGRWR